MTLNEISAQTGQTVGMQFLSNRSGKRFEVTGLTPGGKYIAKLVNSEDTKEYVLDGTADRYSLPAQEVGSNGSTVTMEQLTAVESKLAELEATITDLSTEAEDLRCTLEDMYEAVGG